MEVDIWLMTCFDKEAMERCVRVQEGLARLRADRDGAHVALCAATGEDLPLAADLWPKPGWSPEAHERLEIFARFWDAFTISTADFMCSRVREEDRVYLRDPGIERLKALGRALYRQLSGILGKPYDGSYIFEGADRVRTPRESDLFRQLSAVARELDRLNTRRGKLQLERFMAACRGEVPLTSVMYAWWGDSET
ncbi:MAG: hypothetical protein CVT80_05690 [Alphaproteobacteria bacterium HGW-Alphaproteobacteria-2]|nr:MAG: hypothetical protein CVT80_05690 [Alphaproteobacteria bacterium HGW-Alphaproteobacteria-2]